jgi:DNA-binding PadR family transcriptional regulator
MAGRRGPGGPDGGRGHGPFAGGFGGPFGGGRGRARRGDIRSAILRLLAEEPMHGYQIIQELSARTGGVWQPSPGSIYPTLQALEDQGLVEPTDLDGKRVFHLTALGREQMSAAPETDSAPWDDVTAGAGGHAALREVAVSLMGASRQVAMAGSPGQIQQAVTILKDARRKLYQLLAEDPESAPDA